MHGNMPALQHTTTKISEFNPKTAQWAVKKACGPQESHCEKRYEIQGGGPEMAVMVG